MTTLTFAYSGAAVDWTVPAGVTSITVDCIGGSGGDEFAGTTLRGKGARVQCGLSVTPGEVLRLVVGGRGFDAGDGGFNGGGNSFTGGGGGGGGASDIRQGGTALANRVVVAGGGGGAGANNVSTSFGGGGDAGTVGANGQDGQGGPTKGFGGTGAAGGAGGGGPFVGSAGSLGQGGAGGNGAGVRDGGGGGGGLYGGGGGGAGDVGTGAAGGGGGSSLTTGVSSTITSGYRDNADGLITLTFTEAAHTTQVAPCVGDRFDKANSTTSLGTADTGQAWVARKRIVNSTEASTAVDSVLGIIDNEAYDATDTDDRVNIATIDHGFSNGTFTLTLEAPLNLGEEASIVYRWADDTHMWRLIVARSSLTGNDYYSVVRKLNGSASYTDTAVNTIGGIVSLPLVLKVVANGSAHKAYLNDVLVHDFTDSFNQTETDHGIGLGPYLNNRIGRVNDYAGCPLFPPFVPPLQVGHHGTHNPPGLAGPPLKAGPATGGQFSPQVQRGHRY